MLWFNFHIPSQWTSQIFSTAVLKLQYSFGPPPQIKPQSYTASVKVKKDTSKIKKKKMFTVLDKNRSEK